MSVETATSDEAAAPPRMEADSLRKHYRRTAAVDGVAMTAHAGELVGVIGPNGAGKSTLARILTGQILPEAGTVRVDGRRIDEHPTLARRLTGYVPQRAPLPPFLTGREILGFAAAAHGLAPDEGEARAEELLSRFALGEAADRFAREYSEGMGRKLAVAAALIGAPSLLVLDESLSGLDPRAASEVKQVLDERTRAGATVLLISHALDALERLCTRIVLVDHGRVTGELDREALAERRRRGEPLEAYYLERTGD